MEKINVAELLRDYPKGMELDCTMYEDVYFDYVDRINIIHCYIQYETYRTSITLNQHGAINSDMKSKCIIFPKGKTTWKGFVPPSKFKDGDVVRYSDCIAIFKEWGDATLFRTYVTAYLHGDSTIDVAIPLFGKSIRREARLATEEEKEKLLNSIKENGYKWNEETKTLEDIIKIDIPKGYEFASVNDDKQQVVFTKIQPKYPKTYVECAKLLDCFGAAHIDGYKGELLDKFQELLICRDAYWKLYGEQTGLGKPWSPSKNDNVYCIFRFKGEISKDNFVFADSLILEFPTEEMRDAFYRISRI